MGELQLETVLCSLGHYEDGQVAHCPYSSGLSEGWQCHCFPAVHWHGDLSQGSKAAPLHLTHRKFLYTTCFHECSIG